MRTDYLVHDRLYRERKEQGWPGWDTEETKPETGRVQFSLGSVYPKFRRHGKGYEAASPFLMDMEE